MNLIKVIIFCVLSMSPKILAGQQSIYSLSATSIDGNPVSMSEYQGKTLLIVNTASNCGFTSQLEGLENIYNKYKEKGLVVLGFPSNDFLGQEPGTNEEIKNFCSSKYSVSFPLFTKAEVTGANKQPVYKYLTELTPKELQGSVKWNFEKFLIDSSGQVRARYSSFTKPESEKIVSQIEQLLQEKREN